MARNHSAPTKVVAKTLLTRPGSGKKLSVAVPRGTAPVTMKTVEATSSAQPEKYPSDLLKIRLVHS